MYLIRLTEEVLVDGEHVSKLIEENLADGIVDKLHSKVSLQIGIDDARCLQRVAIGLAEFFVKDTFSDGQ